MTKESLEVRLLCHLRKEVPAGRLEHILGVARLAENLARRHNLDARKARLAGLVHDLARGWSDGRLVSYARRHALRVPEKEFALRRSPVLLHSYVGADLARRLFKIKDRAVLSAAAKHSLGATEMSRFDKLVYLADLLAPDRRFTGAGRLRRLAFENLDRAFLEGVRAKLLYVLSKEGRIHPETVRVWNHFVTRREKR